MIILIVAAPNPRIVVHPPSRLAAPSPVLRILVVLTVVRRRANRGPPRRPDVGGHVRRVRS